MTIILEVALGLAFVYLLFSLLASAINEAVLGYLTQLRARLLEHSLQALLSNRDVSVPSLRGLLWGTAKNQTNQNAAQPGAAAAGGNQNTTLFATQVLTHPLIRGLATTYKPCPNHLAAETFADAVIGTLVESNAAANAKLFKDIQISDIASAVSGLSRDAAAQKLLKSLLVETRNIQEARLKLATWFNSSMERVTGLYKRCTQFWLYVWATILVLALNVDSIEIGKRLLTDAEFRSVMVATATTFVTDTNNIPLVMLPTNAPATYVSSVANTNNVATNSSAGARKAAVWITNAPLSVTKLQEDILKLKLPIGWGNCCTSQAATNAPTLLVSSVLSNGAPCPRTAGEWVLKIFGLLITIAAVSQGAPFWFDLLNRFTNLRSTGKPPPTDKIRISLPEQPQR